MILFFLDGDFSGSFVAVCLHIENGLRCEECLIDDYYVRVLYYVLYTISCIDSYIRCLYFYTPSLCLHGL